MPAPNPHATPPPPELPPDRARRVARQLQMLDELAEIGVELARRLLAQVPDQPSAAPRSAADPFIAYARVTRAVRLTLAMQTRVAEGTLATARPAKPVPERKDYRKTLLRLIVQEEVERCTDGAERTQTILDLHERLEDLDLEEALETRRPSQIALDICRAVGVDPQSKRWVEDMLSLDDPSHQRADEEDDLPPPPPPAQKTSPQQISDAMTWFNTQPVP